MNNKALQAAYASAVQKGFKHDINRFYEILSTQDTALQASWNDATSKGYKGDVDAFSELLGLKKKPSGEASELEQPSPAQSAVSLPSAATGGTSLGTPPLVNPNESRTLKGISRPQAIDMGYSDDAWVQANTTFTENIDEQPEPSFLARMIQEGGLSHPMAYATAEALHSMAKSDGFAGKIFNVIDEAAEGWMRARPEEKATNIGILIGDAIQAGEEITDATVEEYLSVLKARKEFEARYGTDEYYDQFSDAWDKYTEETGSVWAGWFAAVAEHPAAAFTSSVENLSKIANLSQAQRMGEAAMSTITSFTLAGSAIPVVGTIAGFLAGVSAASPTAMAWSSYNLERGLETFNAIEEYLNSNGLEANAKNVSAVANDRELMLDIVAKAKNGAAIIGFVDLATMGIGSKIAKAPIKASIRQGTRQVRGVAKGTLMATPVELLGEGFGEAAKIAVTEEDATLDDISRGFLEETTGAIFGGFKSTAIAGTQLAIEGYRSSYSLNGKSVSREAMGAFIQGADREQINTSSISITNDKKLADILSDRKSRMDIEASIDPSIKGKDRARLVELMRERQIVQEEAGIDLKGDEKSARNRVLASLQEEIDSINEKYAETAVSERRAKMQDPLVAPVQLQAPQPIQPKQAGVIVDEAINKKAVLVEYNGKDVNQEGDLYVDGQTLVLETKDRIYEIGNVDEVSDMDMADVGLAPVTEEVSVNNDGTLRVDNQNWNIQTDLDNRGIEYNKDGDVTRVSLKDNEGKTVMYEGQKAEDIAYQIMLSEIQTPEQEQRVNELLEQDEQFKEQSRLYAEQRERDEQSGTAKTTTQERADKGAKEGAKSRVRRDKKSDKDTAKKVEAKQRQQKTETAAQRHASSIYRRALIANDPKEKARLMSYADDLESSGHTFAPEQKELFDSIKQDLKDLGYTIGSQIKVGDEWTPRTKGKAVFVPDPTKEVGDRTIMRITNKGLYRNGKIVSQPTYIVSVGTRPVEKTNINGKDTRTKARDVNTLKEIMSSVFKLSGKRADAVAKIGDRLVANMAKRAGITKEEMYDRLSFAGADSFNQANIVGTLQFQGDKNDVYGISKKFYANAEDFERDLREGRIVLGGDPANFEGPYVLHVPDTMMSGTMTIGDEQISAEGGVLYPLVFSDENFFWASNESKSMINALNRAAKESTNGKVRLMLVSSNRQKLLSNSVAGEIILKIFSNKAMRDEFNLSKNELKNAIMAANKALAPDPVNAPLGAKINKGMSLESMVNQIVATLSPDNSSFPVRKAFVISLISNVVKVVNSKVDSKTKGNKTAKNIVDFFSQMAGVEPVNIYQKGSSSRLNIEGIREAIGRMLSEKLLDQVSESDVVYAAIEIDVNPNGDTFTSVNTKAEGIRTHGSYNFAITPVNPESKPRVIIFDKHRKWYDFTSAENNGAPIKKYDKGVLPTQKGFSNTVYPAAPPSREINVGQFKGNAAVAFQAVKNTPIEEENGATFNLDGTTYSGGGTVVPAASINFNSAEMTVDDISAFMQEYQAAFTADNFVVGIYKFPGENIMSVDINIVVKGEKQIEQGFEFAKYAGQESIFNLDTFESKKTGNSGKFPKSFSPREISIIARHIKNGTIDRFIQEHYTYTVPEHVMSRMTRDSEGNYVFVHYSAEERDVVKRGTGDNRVTSSEEASALSAVGGLAMYYVDTTSDVPGKAAHVKKIPQDKVYYFNEDLLNFFDEALEQYKKKFPERSAFPSFNDQLAWITKVANEKGFQMVVAEWGSTLRAQTTEEFAPDSRDASVMSTFKDTDSLVKFARGETIVHANHGVGVVVSFKENTKEPGESEVTFRIPNKWAPEGYNEYTSTLLSRPGKSGKGRVLIRKSRINEILLDEKGVPYENEKPKQILFQQQRAAVVMNDVEAIIYALNNPDVTSPLHELAHVFENYLTEEEKATVLQWAGHEGWTTDTSEVFAEGFEKYLAEGVAPDKGLERVFNSLKKWIADIYKGVKNSPLELELSEEMRGLYELMLNDGNHDNVTTGRSKKRSLYQDSKTRRFKTYTQQTLFWVRKRFQDTYAPVMKIQEDLIADGVDVYESSDFKMAEELMHGKTANDLEKRVEVYIDRIIESLKKSGLEVEDLNVYMMALHVKERNQYIMDNYEKEDGSGKSDDWADQTLDYYKDKVDQLEDAAQHVRDLLQSTRERMVEFGLETQELVDSWDNTYENYVPLYGFAQDENMSIDEDYQGDSRYLTGGAGIHVAGPTVKKAKGRETEAANVVGNAVQLASAVIIKSRKNEALQSLYNLILENPSESYYISDKSKGSSSVGVRINGEQKYIVFKDRSIAESLNGMTVQKADMFTRLYSWGLMGWMRKAYTTYNPEFFVTNFARDIQTAIVVAMSEEQIEGGIALGKKVSDKLVGNIGRSWVALAHRLGSNTMNKEAVSTEMQTYIDEWEENGGKTGWSHIKPAEQVVSEIQNKVNQNSSPLSKATVPVKAVFNFVEGVNEVFENSIRLAAYVSAREAGLSPEKSAQLSKNITINFNKYGDWGRAANSVWLFFNAGVQGTTRLATSLFTMKPKKGPLGETLPTYKRFHRAQYAVAGLTALNALMTALNLSISGEDEDGELFYNKIPDYEKERNIIVMTQDGEHYIKIPMPYGLNAFSSMGEAIASAAMGARDSYDATMFTISSMMNAFIPVQFSSSEDAATSLLQTTSPSIIKPFIDMAVNETYNGGTVTRNNLPYGAKTPDSYLSKRAPESVRNAFQWLNEVSGGSENVSGKADFNPDYMWYYMQYLVGAPMVFGERSISIAKNITRRALGKQTTDLESNDIIFLRKVYGEPSKFYDYNLYRERLDRLEQIKKELLNPNVEIDIKRKREMQDAALVLTKLNDKLIRKMSEISRMLVSSAQKIEDPVKRNNRIDEIYEDFRNQIKLWNKTYNEMEERLENGK